MLDVSNEALGSRFTPQGNLDSLLQKYFNQEGPYYTSYPTLGGWSKPVSGEKYEDYLLQFFSTEGKDAPLHLYIHVPFCAKLCWYCLCNIVVTKDREKIQGFLNYLLREIDLLKKFFDKHDITPNFQEIHLGGGTPSHLDHAQIKQLVDAIKGIVDFKTVQEFAMEIDPRTCTKEDILYYTELGVERISFGVQDFDPAVQKAVNRVQPPELIESIIPSEVRRKLKGLNFDLLYGLPLQTPETFRRTVELTKIFSPERVTLLKYAHAPHLRSHMGLIKDEQLPSQELLPGMFYDTVQRFTNGDYSWIGIDNFALKGTDLALAQEKKTVWRTFNGFTPGRTKNMISLGPSSTGMFGRYYAQNMYEHKDYFKRIDDGQLTVYRGWEMSDDDLLRRSIIFDLMCKQEVSKQDISREYGIDFEQYFSYENKLLDGQFTDEGLVQNNSHKLALTDKGRYFTRIICRVFDSYNRGVGYKMHGC